MAANLELIVQIQDRELQTLRKDIRTLSREMGGVATSTRTTGRSFDNLNRSSGHASKSLTQATRGAIAGSGAFRGLGRAVAFSSAAFLGTAGLTAAISKTIGAASDLNEEVNKSRQIFGGSAAAIVAWSRTTAKSAGLSQVAALQAAGAFGNMLTTIGLASQPAADLSKRMVILASDLASFNNQDPTEMLDKLRSGLAGEAEPLRRFGILLSEARVKQEAVRIGLVTQGTELTEQEKVLARYSLILKDSSKAHGDFARTSKGLANTQRSLRAEIDNAAASLGKGLLPAVRDVAREAADFLGKPETQRQIREFSQSVGRELPGLLRDLGGAMRSVAGATKMVVDGLGGVKNTLELVLALKAASKIAGWTDALTTLGTSATTAKGEVAGLRTALGKLPTTLAITLTIEEIIHREDLIDLGKFLGKKLGHGIGGALVATGLADRGKRSRNPTGIAAVNPYPANSPLESFFADGLVGRTPAVPLGKMTPQEALAYQQGVRVRQQRAATSRSGPAGTPYAALTAGHKTLLQGPHVSAGLPQFGGGRTALDIAARPGDKVLAPENGKLSRITGHPPSQGSSGAAGVLGYSLYFEGDSGTVWYMTHLAAVAPEGRYRKGQQIATVAHHPRGDHLHIDHSGSGSAHQVAELASTQPATLRRGGAKLSGGIPVPAHPRSGAKKTAKSTAAAHQTTLSDLFSSPAGLSVREALARARGTKSPKDDVQALQAELSFLNKQLALAKKGTELRVEILEEIGSVKDSIRGARTGKKKAGTTAASELVPTRLQLGLATAQLTSGLGDDLKVLRKTQAFLLGELKGSKGTRRLGILDELRSVRDQIGGIVSGILDKARTAVDKHRGVLGTAFGRVGDSMLAAFDAKTSELADALSATFDELTPAEKELLGIENRERGRTRTDLVADLEKAQKRAARVTGRRSPAAQRALQEAQDALRAFDLEPLAQAERAAADKRRQTALDGLQKQRDAERQELQDKLDEFEAKLEQGGIDMGSAFAKGLLAAFPEFKKAIDAYLAYLRSSGLVGTPGSGVTLGPGANNGIDPAIATAIRNNTPTRSLASAPTTTAPQPVVLAPVIFANDMADAIAKYNRRNGRQLS